MKTANRLDRYFGPAGSTAGVVLIFAGLIMSFYSPSALILIIIGAFIGYTSTGTIIDFTTKRVKFVNNIFGIIPSGRWIDIEPEMKLGIEKSHTGWRTYSRSNRILNTDQRDYRIYLYDPDGQKVMPLIKSPTREEANIRMAELVDKLGLKNNNRNLS